MIHIYDAHNVVRRELETCVNPTQKLQELLFKNNDGNTHIWVFDGPNALRARRDIYPEYKAKRKPPTIDNFFENLNRFQDLLLHTDATVIRVPDYEADDVIAWVLDTASRRDILLHSTDGDLAALGVPMHPEPKLKVPANEIQVYKTLVGDPSDNVPGVKGFGKGTWEKLTNAQRTALYAWSVYDDPVFDLEGLLSLLPKGVQNWLAVPENRAQVRVYARVINFLDVPADEIFKYTWHGLRNDQVIFDEFRGIQGW